MQSLCTCGHHHADLRQGHMSARLQKLWLHHDTPSFQHITFPRPKIMQIHNLSALNWWQLQNVSNCRQQKTSCLLKVVASCHAVVGDSTHSESLLLVICTLFSVQCYAWTEYKFTCVCVSVSVTLSVNSPTGQTPRRIFTVDSLKDADLRKDVPLGGE